MNTIVQELDCLRANLLRVMLSSNVARSIFLDRALRLWFFFLASFSLNIILAATIPIWLIALGPLIFGIPHLFSVVRYLPAVASVAGKGEHSFQRRLRYLGVFLLFMAPLLRAFHFPHLVGGLSNSWELIAGVVIAVFIATHRWFREPSGLLAGLFALGPFASGAFLGLLILASWKMPLLTLGILAFAHNFIAFVIWVKSAKNSRERVVATAALALFAFGTCLFFTHFLDPIAAFGTRFPDPAGVMLSPFALSNEFFPATSDYSIMMKIISAYAFGQAMHYFVWLKAIPEQVLERQTPLSFSQSWRAFREDVGNYLPAVAVLLSIGGIVALFLFRLEMLHTLYISFATSHGYLELAALPFALEWRGRT